MFWRLVDLLHLRDRLDRLETLDLLHQCGLGGELPRALQADALAAQRAPEVAELLTGHRGEGVIGRGGGALGRQRRLHLGDLGLALLVAVGRRASSGRAAATSRIDVLDAARRVRRKSGRGLLGDLRGLGRGDRRGRGAGSAAGLGLGLRVGLAVRRGRVLLPGGIGCQDGRLRDSRHRRLLLGGLEGLDRDPESRGDLRGRRATTQGLLVVLIQGLGVRLEDRPDIAVGKLDVVVGLLGDLRVLLGLLGLGDLLGLLAADGLLEALEDRHRQLQLLCDGELGDLVEGLILEGDGCCGDSGGGGHFNG